MCSKWQLDGYLSHLLRNSKSDKKKIMSDDDHPVFSREQIGKEIEEKQKSVNAVFSTTLSE